VSVVSWNKELTNLLHSTSPKLEVLCFLKSLSGMIVVDVSGNLNCDSIVGVFFALVLQVLQFPFLWNALYFRYK
jgi:hypothetical protein